MTFEGLLYIIGGAAIVVALLWGWTRWGAGQGGSDE